MTNLKEQVDEAGEKVLAMRTLTAEMSRCPEWNCRKAKDEFSSMTLASTWKTTLVNKDHSRLV